MWTQTIWMVGEWASLAWLMYGAWLSVTSKAGNAICPAESVDFGGRAIA